MTTIGKSTAEVFRISQCRSPTAQFDHVHRGNADSAAQERHYRPGYRTNERKLRVLPEWGITD